MIHWLLRHNKYRSFLLAVVGWEARSNVLHANEAWWTKDPMMQPSPSSGFLLLKVRDVNGNIGEGRRFRVVYSIKIVTLLINSHEIYFSCLWTKYIIIRCNFLTVTCTSSLIGTLLALYMLDSTNNFCLFNRPLRKPRRYDSNAFSLVFRASSLLHEHCTCD